MTAITSPGPTAFPTADPITGMTTDPTATCPAGLGPAHPPLPPVLPPPTVLPTPVPPPAGLRPPWYQQKRYAFPLISLVLLVIIGLFGDHTTPAPAPAPVPAPAPRPVPEPAPVAPLTTEDALAGMYYKGTFLVGSQIQPGTYSTQGPTTQDDGQWARLSNTTGDPTAVVAHGIVNGPTTVTILPTDAAFQTTGDVVWVKVQIPAPAPAPAPAPTPKPEPKPDPEPQTEPAPVSTLPTTFGDGTYLVGSQIAPGTYQTPGTTTEFGGGWYRLSGTTGDHAEIIAVEPVKGPATMTVLPTDDAVKFVGEGITWTKIS
jgi:hypothetical protein